VWVYICVPDLVRAVCNTTLIEQNQQEKGRIMYTPSRNIVSCHLSGFAYHEGVQVFSGLKVGTPLELAAEPDNPHDNSAVGVSYQGKKLGYTSRKRITASSANCCPLATETHLKRRSTASPPMSPPSARSASSCASRMQGRGVSRDFSVT